MANSTAQPNDASPGKLPTLDILDDAAVWTPEIQELAHALTEQIRLDQPGMIVNGPPRNGKSRACGYVAAILSECVGYPVTVLTWTIPESLTGVSARVFLQERMIQSDCQAVTHRDLAVLRNRHITHMSERANADGAKRIVIIVDEAQNLWREDYGALVFFFNELERRRLRPFFLLVGQPELGKQADQWMSEDAQQMVGRFSTRTHAYLGIRLDDLEEVLAGFDGDGDGDGDGPEATAAFRTSPKAYAEGWRVAELAPLMRDAVKRLGKSHNVQEEIRLPMQYLRSCLLAMLYRIAQRGMNPRAFQLADAIDCVKSSNFGKVMNYYIRTGVGAAGDVRSSASGRDGEAGSGGQGTAPKRPQRRRPSSANNEGEEAA